MAGFPRVRALERGLAVLSGLSANGPATPRALADLVGLDRATVYRMLETLAAAGYIRAASAGRYHLLPKVAELAAGFRVQDLLLSAIGPVLLELQRAVVWPVSYASFQRDFMLVEESTLAISPYSIRSLKTGTELSLLRTSLGRAVLSALTPQQRNGAIPRLIELDHGSHATQYSITWINQVLDQARAAGYAYNVGEIDPKMSGLAVPLIHEGMPLGALNIIFITGAISVKSAAVQFLPAMRRSIRQLEDVLAAASRGGSFRHEILGGK